MSRLTEAVNTIAGLLVVSALLAGCSAEKKTDPAPVVTGVRVEQAAETTLPQVHPAVATLRATTTSPISAKLLGNVVAVHVKEGDRVGRGDLLIEIDSREVAAGTAKASAGIEEMDRAIAAAEAGASAAEVNRKLATSTWERFRSLRERRSVSPQEYDEVEARYQAATADATRAAESLQALRAKRRQVAADLSTANTFASYARITSPIDGIVASKSVNVGGQAAPGMPLLVVEDDRSFEADALVEESLSARMRPGDRVRVRIDAIGATLDGTITRVVPALDPATRTSMLKIALPADARLRSGLFAEVEFPVGERKGITVAESAIVRRGQLEGVYVVGEGEIASLRLVKSGRARDGRVEILSGLNAGEVVVLDGSQIRDGSRVEVVR
jgi:RND family efflux transporter MFP subunit